MANKQEFIPLSKEEYQSIQKGDIIVRMLAFRLPMELTVTEVTETRIITGSWEFSRETGIEIDEDIPVPVSYISQIKTRYNGK